MAFTEDRVRELFHGIADVPEDARGQRRRPGVLVEEYLVGYEVSVETVTFEGRTEVLGVTDKNLGGAPYFAETGDTFPSALPSSVTGPPARTALDALAAIGFDFGAAHTEIKLTADGPRVIEINGRLGGGMADLLALVSDVNLFEQAGRAAIG